MPIFWRVLIINWCWIFSKAFSAYIEIIIWILPFDWLKLCITLFHLHILKNPCILGINPAWSWCTSFLMYYWILFTKILLRIFASLFISDTGLQFSVYVCDIFTWFWYQSNVLMGWIWLFSSLRDFLEEFEQEKC